MVQTCGHSPLHLDSLGFFEVRLSLDPVRLALAPKSDKELELPLDTGTGGLRLTSFPLDLVLLCACQAQLPSTPTPLGGCRSPYRLSTSLFLGFFSVSFAGGVAELSKVVTLWVSLPRLPSFRRFARRLADAKWEAVRLLLLWQVSAEARPHLKPVSLWLRQVCQGTPWEQRHLRLDALRKQLLQVTHLALVTYNWCLAQSLE